jgi:hypothetical protein
MTDPTNESTRANYAQQDGSARRLWETQRRKANPWEHRGQQLAGDEAEAASPDDPAGTASPEAEPDTLIPQQDRLRLHRPNQQVENPFERLIEHTLQVKLPEQPYNRHAKSARSLASGAFWRGVERLELDLDLVEGVGEVLDAVLNADGGAEHATLRLALVPHGALILHASNLVRGVAHEGANHRGEILLRVRVLAPMQGTPSPLAYPRCGGS